MDEGYQKFQKGSRARLRLARDERLVKGVRKGDPNAFEVLYDRYASSLLSFCLYMLASRHDAEDAVQATFASAYRSLLADERPVSLRPWLFTIARNSCLTTLRKRRPWVELNGEPALNGDPYHELEVQDEVARMLENLRELPERQRASLVLSELHGLSQAEVATVLGVRSEQVKAYVFQARSNLISEKAARDAACTDIRKELATARGAALRKRRLRRHLRACGDCREYEHALAGQRQHFAALLPVVPTLALKMRAVQDVIDSMGLPGVWLGGTAVGGSVAGTVVAGGSMKAIVAKVAAGVVAIGAASGVGVAALDSSNSSEGGSSTTAGSRSALRLAATSGRRGARAAGYLGVAQEEIPQGRRPATGGRLGKAGRRGVTRASKQAQPGPIPDLVSAGAGTRTGSGKARESHGKAGELSGKSGSGGSGGSGHSGKTEAERELASEERARKAQEHQQQSEERERKSEERKLESEEEEHAVGGSHPPPSEAERKRKQEEKRFGKSKHPPRTKEERLKLREEHLKLREEHVKLHEERRRKHEERAGSTPGS